MSDTPLTKTPEKQFGTFIKQLNLLPIRDGASGTLIISPLPEGDKGMRENDWGFALPKKAWYELEPKCGTCIAISSTLYVYAKRNEEDSFNVAVVRYTRAMQAVEVQNFGECYQFIMTRVPGEFERDVLWNAIYWKAGKEKKIRNRRQLDYLGVATIEEVV